MSKSQPPGLPSYVVEHFSQQARTGWKKRLKFLSRGQLDELARLIAETPPIADPEMQIAMRHCDPALVAMEYGGPYAHHIRKLQKIYCSSSRCNRCPHGPFWFSYRAVKSKNLIRVRYEGRPAFSPEVMERIAMDVRPPIFIGELVLKK